MLPMFQFKLSQLMKKVLSSSQQSFLMMTPGDEYQMFKLFDFNCSKIIMLMLFINFCLLNLKFIVFLHLPIGISLTTWMSAASDPHTPS